MWRVTVATGANFLEARAATNKVNDNGPPLCARRSIVHTGTRLCSRLLCVRAAAVTFRMELFALVGLCLALKSITLR